MKYAVLAAAVVLPGCSTTPTTQITAFADATHAVTEKVDTVLGEYNDASLQRQFTDYAATYNLRFAKQLTSDELAKITKPIDSRFRKTLAIYKANQALGTYSKALSELAIAGSRSDIDWAAANLYGAMTSLNDQYRTLEGGERNLFDDTKLATVSTLIAAFGSSIVEERRNKAIKGVVTEADPGIAAICDTLDSQLEAAGLEDVIAQSRKYILTEELLDYRTRVKTDRPLGWRREQIARLYGMQQDISNSKLQVQQTRKAIIAVKDAHATIAKELRADRFTSAAIASTIGRLKDLEKHYDDFDSILVSCEKISRDDRGLLSCEDN